MRRIALISLPAVTALAAASFVPLGAGVADASSQHKHGHHHQTSYSWKITPTGTDEEFRGLAAVSRRVAWASGEEGTVLRTVNGGTSWQDVSFEATTATGDPLALRDIEARDAKHAVALSIGTGEDSRIYATSNGGRTWKERFRNTDPNAFYDCMAFLPNGRGLAMSDPVDGYFQIAQTDNFGRTWSVRDNDGMPPALEGEFGFAASGTCLVSGPWRNFWFVTGGVETPRIFHSRDGGRTWDVADVPMRGGPSAGIYSVDFRSVGKGIAVGGDYEAETDGSDASAFLRYSTGPDWQPSPSPVLGYRSGVAWIPFTRDTAIAVGPSGSDVSYDGGRSWTNFDADRYDGIHCAWNGACWGSGTDGRIAKLVRSR